MLMEGKLNSYLAGIDQQAQERLETLIEQMKQAAAVNGGRSPFLLTVDCCYLFAIRTG